MLPEIFNKNTTGEIRQKQTTFIRIRVADGKEYIIHYKGKQEYSIESDDFVGVTITENHPLLKHYKDHTARIYISSKCNQSDILLRKLKGLVQQEYNGWRTIKECFNSQCDLMDLLEDGFGLLYEGPDHLGKKVAHLLTNNKVRYKYEKCKNHLNPNTKVLVVGDNVVVAEDFYVEAIES